MLRHYVEALRAEIISGGAKSKAGLDEVVADLRTETEQRRSAGDKLTAALVAETVAREALEGEVRAELADRKVRQCRLNTSG